MYKKVFLILCSVILLGVLLSCATDDYDDGRDDAPPPPDYRYGTMTLDNNALSPITKIYLKPSNESDWGSMKLIQDLKPGEPWWIDVRIPVNSYSIFVDLKVAIAEHDAYLYNIRIDAGETVELSALQPDPESLQIVYIP